MHCKGWKKKKLEELKPYSNHEGAVDLFDVVLMIASLAQFCIIINESVRNASKETILQTT